GMWMFLATEILFFGGVLAAYTVYRVAYPAAWAEGAHHQNVIVGTFNTAVLLGSSFTMALAVYFSQLGKRMSTVVMLVLTLILGSVFLGVKAFEYSQHFHEGLLPGFYFTYQSPQAPRVELFMTFY